MRFRAISSLAFSIICCGTMLGTMLVSGCGSGHQTVVAPSPTPAPSATPAPAAPTTVKAAILWPQRSRQTSTTASGSPVEIAALTSASSAVITFAGADQTGGDIVINANRPAGPSATAMTYTSTGTALPGVYPLSVKFYNKPLTAAGALDSTAVVVATAQANTQILANGTLSATITTVGQIQSVVVTAGQKFLLGSTLPIAFTAYGTPLNGLQTIIPVVPGAESVTATNVDAAKAPVLSIVNGLVQAVYPGQATVTVTVDNINSDPTLASSLITVYSNQTIYITSAVSPIASGSIQAFPVPVGGQLAFSAPTTSPSGSPVTWSLSTDAVTAASGAKIDPVTGVFSAPNRSGGPYAIVATSQYDASKTATASVVITSSVNVYPTGLAPTVHAEDVYVGANKNISLPVTVTGTAITGVTYTIVGNTATSTPNGTITTAGTLTAPNAQGVYTVLATSNADTAQVVTFTVHVNPSVTIAPHKTTISVDQTVTFFSNVVGGTDSRVTYAVVEAGGGQINAATGVYTAPMTAGTYHVTATSVEDPTLSDTATIIVQAGSGVIIVN